MSKTECNQKTFAFHACADPVRNAGQLRPVLGRATVALVAMAHLLAKAIEHRSGRVSDPAQRE